MPYENPAGRLHALFVAASSHDTKNPAIHVWSEVLGVGPYSEELDIAVVERFGQLIDLYDETTAALEAIDGLNRDLFMVWARPTRNLVRYSSLYRSWDSQRGVLSVDTLRALAFCDDRLARESGQERTIAGEKLRPLAEQVADLEEAILDSDLPPELKDLLFRLAREISNALAEYRIRGVQRLVEASELVAGAAFTHWQDLGNLRQQENSDLVARLGLAWRSLVDLITLATGVQQLGPGAAEVVRGLLGE